MYKYYLYYISIKLKPFLRKFIKHPFESLRKTTPLSEQTLNSSEALPNKQVYKKQQTFTIQLVIFLKMEISGTVWKKKEIFGIKRS